MECRIGCAACCIVPSISESIPNHPNGKAAFERCKNLNDQNRCTIWGTNLYPKTCAGFKAEKLVCGDHDEEAFETLSKLLA